MEVKINCTSTTLEPPLKETPNKGKDSEHQMVTFL